MSELTKNWITEFQDKETRHIYADNFLNTYIATQLKVLREDYGWTQAQLAEETGMKQERISVLEDVNYESWTIKTLKRFARAFDLRLSIKFESFGSFLTDYDSFNRENLKRLPFDKDPAFQRFDRIPTGVARVTGATGAKLEVVPPTPAQTVQLSLGLTELTAVNTLPQARRVHGAKSQAKTKRRPRGRRQVA